MWSTYRTCTQHQYHESNFEQIVLFLHAIGSDNDGFQPSLTVHLELPEWCIDTLHSVMVGCNHRHEVFQVVGLSPKARNSCFAVLSCNQYCVLCSIAAHCCVTRLVQIVGQLKNFTRLWCLQLFGKFSERSAVQLKLTASHTTFTIIMYKYFPARM